MAKLDCMFPAREDGRFWLYLVGRPDGGVKVGNSCDPRVRLLGHRRAGMAWCHLLGSGDRGFAFGAERNCIKSFSLAGERRAYSETFDGLTKAEAIGLARGAVDAQRRIGEECAANRAEREAVEAFRAAFRASVEG